MIYFISDTHFCHKNIISRCNRPFENVTQMNDALISNWNRVVGKADEIYVLGDFSFRGTVEQTLEILGSLKGKKHLIVGNHDLYLNKQGFDRSAFLSVSHYLELNYKDARYILFHYPIVEWAHYHRKSVHLYGHLHRQILPINEEWGKRAISVAADVINFTPISAEEVYAKAFGDVSSA